MQSGREVTVLFGLLILTRLLCETLYYRQTPLG